ncbi:helix-turn-helix transcriptional regulator [Paenibacillus sp. P96]|uniref:Helix-turn-helix transcriptional regulator n=1 Tax=Paenibacillus zeirhizosphaerae TaxID=2987519 RepID=A0ABT9FXE6_9BACL|nr:helix-turn-helix transcriptional regulator [Paenibacillus sp. P96]MDP4099403.1 helix-turn-helix transcriptional regulator [Paenibacillus sp. P96]
MSEILELVGARIRDLRKAKGYSQEALAELSGFNPSYIGFIERAERNISLRNLEKIAKALDIGVYQLFTYEKEKEQLFDDDIIIQEIVFMLRERGPKDARMLRNIMLEIFNPS